MHGSFLSLFQINRVVDDRFANFQIGKSSQSLNSSSIVNQNNFKFYTHY